MNILSFILLLLSIAVFVCGVRLHFSIARRITEANATCIAHKTDLYRAAHGAMFLSAAYAIAEVRWLIMGLDTKIPSIDDIMWNCLEAGFLGYVAWCCHVGAKLIKSHWNNCQIEG